MNEILIAIGGNMPGRFGHPHLQCRKAVAALEQAPELRALRVSGFWSSPAFPAGSGPDFVNACVCAQSDHAPDAILARLHAIEADMGRVRDARWGPRVVDLDLLAVGQVIAPDATTEAHWRTLPPAQQREDTPDVLILPHPRMAERPFVLAPLRELAPDWRHPVTGLSVEEMWAALPADRRAEMTRLTVPN